MKKVYLIIGCPGSGKTWVCEQLIDKYNYIPHDLFIDLKETYVDAIDRLSGNVTKPLLIETPFSISQILVPLKKLKFDVEQIFIQESEQVLAARYKKRENKDIPMGHLTRQRTYMQRAKDGGHFYGTANEVLNHLRAK